MHRSKAPRAQKQQSKTIKKTKTPSRLTKKITKRSPVRTKQARSITATTTPIITPLTTFTHPTSITQLKSITYQPSRTFTTTLHKLPSHLTTITPTPSFQSTKIAPLNTISTRHLTLLRITSITTSTKSTTKSLVIPSTRPFSSANDGEDHDHGAYERKPPSDPSQAMKITIIDREGVENVVDCKVGDNVLQLMRIFQERNPKLYLEGACESSLACSTCHIILDDKSYNLLSQLKEATEEEEDLLDMASCLSPTSRLGCQVNLVKEMDGAKITLPKFSRNFYVDGHVPQPH